MSRLIRFAPLIICCNLPALALCLFLACPAILSASVPASFSGVVTVLATGSTSLSGPTGLTVDPAGNVYIADTSNNQIVKIDPQGAASVLAVSGLSTPLSSPSGVAVDGSRNLYMPGGCSTKRMVATPMRRAQP
jgi:sugar lactone lactonase YvrE